MSQTVKIGKQNWTKCEICETVNVACDHHRIVSLIESKLTGENIEAFDRGVERIKTFIEHRLRPIIAHQALSLAEMHYGKSGIIDHWRESRRRNNQQWTAEEEAEFAEVDRQEREKMIADYTPPTDWSGRDVLNIVRYLLLVTEHFNDDGTSFGDTEAFDEEFERIMMMRYHKMIVQTENGKRVIFERIKSLDESDAIITT